MALPVNNLPVSSILSTLGITSKKARDIFYNSNGTLKSELELKSIVTGVLNTSYCSDLATLRTRRNLASFKGYTNFILSISTNTYSQDWRGISNAIASGKSKITVSCGGATFSISSNNSALKFLKYADSLIPYWDVNYDVTLEDRTGILTVTAGGQSATIIVTQKRKPYITGLPLNPNISNIKDVGSPSSEEFSITSNYGSEWNVSSDDRDFWGSISNERKLRISYVPELSVGNNNKSGSATLTISLHGVVYNLDVTGTYFNEGGQQQPIEQ